MTSERAISSPSRFALSVPFTFVPITLLRKFVTWLEKPWHVWSAALFLQYPASTHFLSLSRPFAQLDFNDFPGIGRQRCPTRVSVDVLRLSRQGDAEFVIQRHSRLAKASFV
jgi:hypothetical protein